MIPRLHLVTSLHCDLYYFVASVLCDLFENVANQPGKITFLLTRDNYGRKVILPLRWYLPTVVRSVVFNSCFSLVCNSMCMVDFLFSFYNLIIGNVNISGKNIYIYNL